MTTFNKKALIATAAVALLASASAQAGTCKNGEVCKLNTTVISDTDYTISGIKGVDLTGINVKATGDIKVNVTSPIQNAYEFSQGKTHATVATLNLNNTGTTAPNGKFEVAVSAIANNASITTQGATAIEGIQNNKGDVAANANINLANSQNVKKVNVNVTSVANNASFNNEGPNSDMIVESLQRNTGTVSSVLNMNMTSSAVPTTNNADIAVAAIGNNTSGTFEGDLIGSTLQANAGAVKAVANVNTRATFNPVSVTAVGNNISFGQAVK